MTTASLIALPKFYVSTQVMNEKYTIVPRESMERSTLEQMVSLILSCEKECSDRIVAMNLLFPLSPASFSPNQDMLIYCIQPNIINLTYQEIRWHGKSLHSYDEQERF